MAAPFDKPTILVVDDSDEVRKATLRLLRIAGYDATGAADGGEGLKTAYHLRPAAIVTDLVMPVLTASNWPKVWPARHLCSTRL